MAVWWRMLSLACVLLPSWTIEAAPELVGAGCVVHRLGQLNKESYTPTVPLLGILPIALKLPRGWEEFTLGLESSGSHDRYIKIESIKETIVVSVRMLDEASGTVVMDSMDLPPTLSEFFHGSDGWTFLTFSVDEGHPTLVVEDVGSVTFLSINVGRVLGVYTQVPQVPEELSLEVGFYCQKEFEMNETIEATASPSITLCETSEYLVPFKIVCGFAAVLFLAVVSLVVYVVYLHRGRRQRENRKGEAKDDVEKSPLMEGKVERNGSMEKDKGGKEGQQVTDKGGKEGQVKDKGGKEGQVKDKGGKEGQQTSATEASKKLSSMKENVPFQTRGNSKRQTGPKPRSTSISETSKPQHWR